MRAKRPLGRGGFTLIELLVTLAIAAITILTVSSVNVLNQRETIENRLLHDLQDDMRYTVEVIVPFLRMGSQVHNNGDNTYTVLIPVGAYPKGEFKFGFNPSTGSVWVNDVHDPICSQIAALNVTEEDGLVTFTLVSVDTLPGVRSGLPLTLSTKVMMRNF
jgi:prepilin-type N-terminal cleavage/methylation domain-containing protein